jgi:hypothetical protein
MLLSMEIKSELSHLPGTPSPQALPRHRAHRPSQLMRTEPSPHQALLASLHPHCPTSVLRPNLVSLTNSLELTLCQELLHHLPSQLPNPDSQAVWCPASPTSKVKFQVHRTSNPKLHILIFRVAQLEAQAHSQGSPSQGSPSQGSHSQGSPSQGSHSQEAPWTP